MATPKFEVIGLHGNWKEWEQSSTLNDRHLFERVGDADQFRTVADGLVPSHAPFLVYSIWSVK